MLQQFLSTVIKQFLSILFYCQEKCLDIHWHILNYYIKIHADYEATLLDTYGADYEDTLVIEGGATK